MAKYTQQDAEVDARLVIEKANLREKLGSLSTDPVYAEVLKRIDTDPVGAVRVAYRLSALSEAGRRLEEASLQARDAGIPPDVWVEALLLDAAALAGRVLEETDLAKALEALSAAVGRGEFEIVERKGTMLSVANGYLKGKASTFATSRPTLVRRIYGSFPEKYCDDERVFSRSVEIAILTIAPPIGPDVLELEPVPGWEDSIREKCRQVHDHRTKASQRTALDYCKAVLRGYGVSEQKANDWTKFLKDL